MTKADLDPAEIENLWPGYGAAEVKRLIKATRPSSVTRQWGRLSSILTANLGVEYFGATDEAIEAAEASTCRWPTELRELYRCVERADHRRGMLLLPPQLELMPVAQVEKRHEFWVEANRNLAFGRRIDIEAEMAKPAGTAAGAMLPGFIPFANDDADTLFVDARSGPLHGCVNLWPDADVARRPPIWRSLSAMLEDLVFALERNTTMSMRLTGWSRYQPYVEGDRLVWEARA
ncbi:MULTISPECIES: SMI1/KNR4 family protein [unclassified Rhodococcus (in: high G+C Gram-positive bacteria)]|uniref:SMI1/KNR4 family protein n=1 Tax=unclassified Rhodococcus (in: high G+C Gram-positive bacteria) TaxID=192944 RepID=UPI0011EED8AC|nr:MULTISPECIES: SMI1/KNR4 family protein [unclassified Rhodococcus (in: high G+C Gram-positive bacteria)]KAA0925106.1 SMI1/KNR4 family protein [Rhodococcus sp. ANT_H53B]MDV7989402.1 SMI1/KNR4 family protein [Rhodococcus sp. IEGM 1374]